MYLTKPGYLLNFRVITSPSHIPTRTLANQVASVSRKISRWSARSRTDPSLRYINAADHVSRYPCHCLELVVMNQI